VANQPLADERLDPAPSGTAGGFGLWCHRLFLPHLQPSAARAAYLGIVPCRHIGHRSCEVSCLTQATMQCMWNE
jgi:hypothetical protein